MRCEEAITGPLEIYVLDPDVDDGARWPPHVRSAAWPIVDEPATRVDVDGAALDGDTTYEIVRPDRRATIVARMGERFGRKPVRLARKDELVLSLDTALPVERTVAVGDARGGPVPGARVGTAPRAEIDAGHFNVLERKARVTTDSNGAASVLQRAPDHVAFVCLPLLGVLSADEDDPLWVTLPETSALAVSARPSTAAGRVTLRTSQFTSEHVLGDLGGTTRTLRNAHLPLGIDVQVRMEGRGVVAEQWITTPEQPGEELAVVLEVLRAATLPLRLVDEAHAPLPGIRRTALAVPGHIAVDVTRLPDGARIEFEPELEVELALTCQHALPERLRIRVEREGYDLPAPHLGSYRLLNVGGTRTVSLPGPGRYVAHLDSADLVLTDPTFEVRADTRRVELVVR